MRLLALTAPLAFLLLLAACEQKVETKAAAPGAAVVDPNAPAPGTEAAEAIGLDSDVPIVPPEKTPRH